MSHSKTLIKNYTIGSDFEMFVQNTKTGDIVSAEPYIKGTKHVPFNFNPEHKYFATSLDNVLAEACIPPTNDRECFVKNINISMEYIRSILPEGYSIASLPAAILKDEYLQSEAAKLFGCESDYNVWLKNVNQKPLAENQNLRSAGTHIHVGYDNPNQEVTEQAVKTMDLFLSVPGLLIEPDNDRRKLYGKAGAFRFKPEYGFEHRVLSGYFTKTDELKAWIFDNTVKAIEFVNDGRIEELEAVSDQVQTAINSNDKVLASNLIKQFEIPML